MTRLMEETNLLRIIYDSVDETNRQLPADRHLDKNPETVLLGEGSHLDSLGLISFIVSFEEALAAACGLRLNLLEGELLDDPTGPLRDIRSLVAYVQRQGVK